MTAGTEVRRPTAVPQRHQSSTLEGCSQRGQTNPRQISAKQAQERSLFTHDNFLIKNDNRINT